jgi:hypothetical protein
VVWQGVLEHDHRRRDRAQGVVEEHQPQEPEGELEDVFCFHDGGVTAAYRYGELAPFHEEVAAGDERADDDHTGFIVLLLRLRRTEQFLHICAWSRTIEYQGEWLSIEAYLSRKFGFSISHGISPLEAKKMRAALPPELAAAPPAPRQD